MEGATLGYSAAREREEGLRYKHFHLNMSHAIQNLLSIVHDAAKIKTDP